MKYLDLNGLSYFWNKVKSKFIPSEGSDQRPKYNGKELALKSDVRSSMVYSTTEWVDTGEKWIDGGIIYTKTFHIQNINGNAYYDDSIKIDVDKIEWAIRSLWIDYSKSYFVIGHESGSDDMNNVFPIEYNDDGVISFRLVYSESMKRYQVNPEINMSSLGMGVLKEIVITINCSTT